MTQPQNFPWQSATTITVALGLALSPSGAMPESTPQQDDKAALHKVVTLRSRPWEEPGFSPRISISTAEDERQSTLLGFAQKMVQQTIDPVPEFDALAAEHFWDLI